MDKQTDERTAWQLALTTCIKYASIKQKLYTKVNTINEEPEFLKQLPKSPWQIMNHHYYERSKFAYLPYLQKLLHKELVFPLFRCLGSFFIYNTKFV